MLQQAGAELRIYPVFLDGKEHPNVRMARPPSGRPGKIISVIVRDNPDNGWKELASTEQTTEISLEGKKERVFEFGFV